MAPVVSQVKDVLEFVAERELSGDLQSVVVKPVVFAGINVGETDPSAVGQLEDVQVREVPPRERHVDRLGQLRKGVAGPNHEDPPRRRIALDVPATLELDTNLKPSPRHPTGTLTEHVARRAPVGAQET